MRAIAGPGHDHDAKAKGAKIGDVAPDFSLVDQNGTAVRLSDHKGKIVVLEWFNNECPYVVKFYRDGHMNKFAQAAKDKGVIWLAVNSTSPSMKQDSTVTDKSISEQWKIDRPILNDGTGEVGHLYGAKRTPHMYVVNADGVLAYMGAIDDNPSADTADIAGAKNYVMQAIDELQAGKSVSQAETKAYGCGVKYAK